MYGKQIEKNEEEENFHGGDALVRALHAEGIDCVFSIPGGEFLPFLEAVDRWGLKNGWKYIGVRHEQGAAHMADAYARVSGKVGVVAGTLGPGLANIVPGICTPYFDNVPVLIINPAQDLKFEDHHRLQAGIDQLGLLKPIVKYQKHIVDPNRIIWGTQKCFKALKNGRPNPVHLQIREDAFYAQVEPYGRKVLQPSQYRDINPPAGNPINIKNAVELLKNAKKPLLISGGGVTSSNGWESLQRLSLEYKIPCITTVMGIGTMSTNHETYIGATLGNGAVMTAAREADVVIALGTKFSYILGYGKPPVWNTEAKLIQVDIDPQMIGKNRPVDVGILGDCKVVIEQLYDELKTQNVTKWSPDEWVAMLKKQRQEAIDSLKGKMTTSRTPCHPYRLIKELTEFMEPEDILCVDGGDICVETLGKVDFVKPRGPRTVLNSIGFGHLGTGIPFAIGAKVGKPDVNVFMITGDGSFLFNVQELDTAIRYDIPFVAVIADNSSWGMIENAEKRSFGRKRGDFCVKLESDYVKIAQGFGCYAERIENPDEIKAGLQRALDSKKPAIIVVPIQFIAPANSKLLASFRQIKF